ncbi:protein Mpv17 [Aplysia californica]|uniref:Mitochondrial inner membrane protein Mpv17 n=1 Tax=Aplysia californica TaxID=6500 RepID=A0ABM0K2R7_APLCA|nr:protein Mpv17 [Aplysia californica]
MAASLWRGYLRLLEKFPLRTMASTTGTLMATGDCISQFAVEKKSTKEYDIVRTGRFFVFGFCVIGPMMRGWYFTLDKLYAGKNLAALKMMATDQLCGAPVFISVFICGMSVLRMESLDEIKAKFKRDFIPIMTNNYKVWPASQFINFYFLPLQHRVLFVNFIALGWNTYLAWASEKK